MVLPCSCAVSIEQLPGSRSSSCQGSLLRIRWVFLSFHGRFANTCFQRVKIDRANQLVKAAVAQVWALEFAMGALLLRSSVTVLIFFAK